MSSANHYILEALEPRLLLSADGLSGLAPSGVGAGDRPDLLDQQAIVEEVFQPADKSSDDLLSNTSSPTESSLIDLFESAEELVPAPVVQGEAESEIGTELNQGTNEVHSASPGNDFGILATRPVSQDILAPAENDSVSSFSEAMVETLRAANGPPKSTVDAQLAEANVAPTASGQSILHSSVDPLALLVNDNPPTPKPSSHPLHLTQEQPLLARNGLAIGPRQTLSGSGTVLGSVTNQGIVSPGNSPGIQNFNGDLTLGATGVLDIEIAGTSSGQFDQVNVTGVARLGGILRITLLGTPALQAGDSIDILTFGSSAGDFLKYENLAIGNNLFFEPVFSSGKLTLTVKTSSIARPLFFIPGFGGTFAADESPAGLQEYFLARGIHPDKLALEPLTNAYSDIVRSFVNVGYTLDLNLFVVKWDWRVPVALLDGVVNGSLSATQSSITDSTFESGLDYLGYYLSKAGQIWQNLTGTALNLVDMVTHSTGGLVARSYIQSTAYPAIPAVPTASELPAVRNLVQTGVPNEGASSTFVLLHNDFSLKTDTRALARLLDVTYDLISEKDSGGNYVRGLRNPDGTTTFKTTFDTQSNPAAAFVAYYVGAFGALLPAYDSAISRDGGATFTALTAANDGRQNDLLLDLNYDSSPNDSTIEANLFIDRVVNKVTVIYGSGIDTQDQIIKKTGLDLSVGAQNEILTFDRYLGHLPASNETWYLDVKSSTPQGDGTVPARSASALFQSDAVRQGTGKLALVSIGVTSTSSGNSVGHSDLVYDIDSQKQVVLAATGVTATTAQISRANRLNQSDAALKAINLGVISLRDVAVEVFQLVGGIFETLGSGSESSLQMAMDFARQSLTDLLGGLSQTASFSVPSVSTDLTITLTAGATPGTLGKILIGATGASAFAGAGTTGVRFNNGQLGVVIYGNGTYAVDAYGSAAVAGVPELVLEGTLHVRRNTAGTSVNETISIPLAGGGTRTVTLAFTQNEVLRMSGSLSLAISQFVYLRGNIAFDLVPPQTVTLEDNTTTQVLGMTIGASNVHFFMGIGGPYWLDTDGDGVIEPTDTPNSGASGLALQNVNVGLALLIEPTLLLPARYLALRVEADSAALVGITGIQATADRISIGVNLVAGGTDTVLTPEPAIKFSAMNDGGLSVPTGGTPVKLDFSGRILRASVADLTLQVSQFIFVRGSFAFEKGATLDVPLAGGGTTEVETMTVGAAGVHVFAGIAGPYWTDTDLDGVIEATDTPSTASIGLALQNVNVGLLIAKETALVTPAKYTALKVTATSASTVGMGSLLTVDAKGITVGYNSVTSSTDTVLTPEAAINFSTMTGGGFNVPTGGTSVKLDFGDRIIRASVADLTLQVSQFIFVRGSFAFEKGATLDVPLAGGGTTEVETMTVGAAGVHVFAGIAGPYWTDTDLDGVIEATDTPSTASIGLALQNVNVGLLIAKETALLAPAKYTALKVTATSASTVGMGSLLTVDAKGITVGYNSVTSSTDTVLTPEAAINFSTMTGGGFNVPTGGTSVKLDFSDRIIRASVADATIQLSEFVFIRGAVAFEKGGTRTVDLVGGLSPDPIGTSKELEFLTVAGSHLHAFVGMKGPYWMDSNNNGSIGAGDTPMSGSVGLAIQDFSFGLAIMRPTSVVDPGKYFALKATAKSVSLVGVSGVTATVRDITVELNQSSPSTYGVPLFPVVNFSTQPGGKYSINTGGVDPTTNAPITVDLRMNSPLVRAEGFVHLNIASSVYLSGNVAFELGPTKTVTVSDNSTKTVSTMSIGAGNVTAFIGANGPYWTDTNGNNQADAGELSSTAIGFSIADFDAGLLVMASTTLSDLGAYVALKASVAGLGLVNMPAGITASGAFDVELNLGIGTSAVNLAASFPANGGNPAGYSVRTGPSSPSMLLNFTGPKIDLKLTGTLGVVSAVNLTGTFFFDISPGALKVLADGRVAMGPAGDFFNMQGVGVLIVNSSGVAADIDISLNLGGAIPSSEIGLSASARFIINTTGVEQGIIVPTKYIAQLNATTQSRLLTDASGNKYYPVPAGAPRLDGTTAPAGAYVVVKFNATLRVLTFDFVGNFQMVADSTQFTISADATVGLSLNGTDTTSFSVKGDMFLNNAGKIAAGIDLPMAPGASLPSIPGLSWNITTRLQFNTGSSNVTLPSVGVVEPGFSVTAGGTMTISGMTISGSFRFAFGTAKTTVFANGTISMGPAGNFFNMSGLGVLVLSSAGVAADIDISLSLGSAMQSLGLTLGAGARVVLNTTGTQQTVDVPTDFVSRLNAATQARLQGTAGSKYYVVSASAPRLDGTTAPAGSYVMVTFSGTIRVLTFDFVGNFQLVAETSRFQIKADASLNLGLNGTNILSFLVKGDMFIDNAGRIAAGIDLNFASGFALPSSLGFSLSATFRLEFNVGSAAINLSGINIEPGFRVVASGTLGLSSLTLTGTFTFTFAADKFTVGISAFVTIFGASFSANGYAGLYYDSNPGLAFSIRLSLNGGLPSPAASFTISGTFQLTINTSYADRTDVSSGALIAARSFRIGVTDVNVNLFGFTLTGALVIQISTAGLEIPNFSLALNFFNVASLTVSGSLYTNGNFSFTASAGIGFGNVDSFGMSGSMSVTFSNTGFGGNVSATFGAFGIKLSAGGDFYIDSGQVKIAVYLSLQITPAFSFRIWTPWKTYTVHVPALVISGTFRYTFGSLSYSSPPPPPTLARKVGNTLYLNMGSEAGFRGGNYATPGDESYNLTKYGSDGVSVSALGYTQNFTGVSSIVVTDTLNTNNFISIANDVTASVSINAGRSVSGTNRFFTGGGFATVQGGTGNTTVKSGAGGGAFYAGTGQSDVTDTSNGLTTVYAPGWLSYSLNDSSLNYDNNDGTTHTINFHNVKNVILNGAANATYETSSLPEPGGQAATPWTGNATFNGTGSASIIKSSTASSLTLTNNVLTESGTNITLNGLAIAELFGNDANNTFTISGWTGTGSIDGRGGSDTIVATNDTNFGLTNSLFTRSGFGNFSLTGIDSAILTGGGSNNSFSISGWTGNATLNGAGGSDTYTVYLNGTGAGTFTINDSGATAGDTLTVQGTAADDNFTISGSQVLRSGEVVTYSNVESLTVWGYDGSDAFNITGISVPTTINGGNGNDGFTVANTSAALTINGETGADSITINNAGAALSLNGDSDNDTFNLRAFSAAVTLNTGSGVNLVNVGSAELPAGGNVNAIGGLLTLNGGGTDTLNVNDTGDGAANTGLLTALSLTGLGMAAGINYSSVETLLIALGSGGSTFNIQSTSSNTTTTVRTGNGSDTVNVSSGAGTGSGGNANGMGGKLNVEGEEGWDILNVDDTADGGANAGFLTNTRLTGLGMAGNDSSKGIEYSNVETLNISLGSGDDTFNIQSLFASTLTNLNTGDGANTVNFGSFAPATGGTVNSIQGKVVVSGQGSADTLNVDDVRDSTGNTGELTSTRLTGLGMGDSSKGIQYATIETLNINLGSGSDDFTIQTTHAGVTVLNTFDGADRIAIRSTSGITTVNSGNGGDTINVGTLANVATNAGGTLNLIAAALTINGNGAGGDHDTLNLDDTGDAAANTGTLTTTMLTGLGIGVSGITYGGLETLNLNLGSGSDVLNIRGTSAVTNIVANSGDDRVYVSSLSSESTTATPTDFLRGNLDQILGTLNFDLGAGRHVLMISDEAATAGDGTGANPVRITDQPVAGLGLPSTEITITGLAPAPAITYKAAAAGNFADGITIWTGWGNETIRVEGTHQRGDGALGSLRTVTTLNTGLGDDSVTVDLNTGDGYFVLNTQGPENDYVGLRSDRDTVNASTSSRSLVIFGGQDDDSIRGGQGADILFADRGLVTYHEGNQVTAIMGNGGPGDRTDGVERTLGRVETASPNVGGDDFVYGLEGRDLVFGGFGNDFLDASAPDVADDILVGDNGRSIFTAGILTQVETTATNLGGNDTLNAGKGANIAFGGVGDDIILAGGDTLRDILVGDNGTANFDPANGRLLEIFTGAPGDAGRDVLTTGDGSSVVFGGSYSDLITSGTGSDILVGDNGRAVFDATTYVLISITTTAPEQVTGTGRVVSGETYDDVIHAGEGNNVVFGGSHSDFISTLNGDDIVVGDNGLATFDANAILRAVETNATTIGGDDRILTNRGADIVLAGSGNDYVDSGAETSGDVARDILIGDNGRAEFDAGGNLVRIFTAVFATGGNDTLFLGGGNNVAFGGVGNDSITAGSGDDIIVGDNGEATFDAISHALVYISTTSPANAGTDTIDAANGNNVVFGGSFNDSITTGTGGDVAVGDNGKATFDPTSILRTIETSDPNNGGDDLINTGIGADIVLGGSGKDTIDSGSVAAGDVSRDVAVGDNGQADFDAAGFLVRIFTTDPATGDADTILIGGGDNVAFGGVRNDTITADSGRDIIVGDNGEATFDATRHVLVDIRTTNPANAGVDDIKAGNGSNVVLGGTMTDTIETGTGADVVVGDNGFAMFYANTGILREISTEVPTLGGDDTVTSGTGPDVVFGGSGEDNIDSGSVAAGDTSRDIVLGDNGRGEFDTLGRLTYVTTLDTATGGIDTILIGAGDNVAFGGFGADTITAGNGHDIIVGDNGFARFDLVTLAVARVSTSDASLGGVDLIAAGDGNNIVFGGTAGDTITTGAGDDIVVGDSGYVDFVIRDQDTSDIDVIASTDFAIGSIDDIKTFAGSDIVIGGADADTIDVGGDNNIVFGDNAEITAAVANTTNFSTQPLTIGKMATVATGVGGIDTVKSGTGRDIIFGGTGGDIIIANVGETPTALDADNIVLADDGFIDFVLGERTPGVPGADTAPADIDVIESTDENDGGVDQITTGAGSDIVIGGQAGDVVVVGDGHNIVIGDNGKITASNSDIGRFATIPMSLGRVATTAFGIGGTDSITSGSGNDLILGGHDNDTIGAGNGDNVVAGDDAAIEFTRQDRDGVTPGADLNPADIDFITSLSTTLAGGVDTITTGNGKDIVIGGRFDDAINAGVGRNLVVGDSGKIIAANENTTANRFGAQAITVGRIETIEFGDGGIDTITTLGDNDVVLGGHEGDTINAGDGDNVVIGDDAALDYVRVERGATLGVQGADSEASDIDLIVSTSTTLHGGIDTITTGNGNDIVIGGRFDDTINAGGGRNLVIGDSGMITAANEDANRFGAQSMTVGRIETIEFGDGGIDFITTLGGNDVILGGHLGDTVNAGDGDNVVIGDDAAIDYVRVERGGATPGADTDAADIDLITSLSTTAAGGADTITTGNGHDIIIGGRDGDTVNAGNGNNIVVGDSADLIAASSDASRFGTQTITVGRIETTQTADGGADQIQTGVGYDLILGGMAGDTIDANVGETTTAPDAGNVVLGDNGFIDFVRAEREATELGGDINPADIDVIGSTAFADGGVDTIKTGLGLDLVMGGQSGDTLLVSNGNNVIIGDSGKITAANENVNRFGTQPLAMGRIETVAFGVGGTDTITSGSGNDLVLGGHDTDTISAGEGDNVVAGDDAAMEFTRQERDGVAAGVIPGADLNASDIDLIVSISTTLHGGIDTITTGNGNDIVIGGRLGDTISAAGGRNIVIGDSGMITAANEDANRFGAQSMTVGRIETTTFNDGGIDTITTLAGSDTILGGHLGDIIDSGEGDNVVIGDDGAIDLVRFERGGVTPGAETNAADIDFITSLSTTLAGGVDTITTGNGNDIVIGGRLGDTISAAGGRNLVIGDSGMITAANEDANRFGAQLMTVGRIETIEFGDGGIDFVTTLGGNDVILGGHLGDTVNAGDGDNVVIGDDAAIDYVRVEREGITSGADTNAGDIDLITSLSTTAAGGADTITTGNGHDIIIGGRFGDAIRAGDGNNLVVSDSGVITAVNEDAPRFGSQSITVGRIETITTGDGGVDEIRAGIGQDILIGGAGTDRIDGGAGDDLILGDNAVLDRTGRVNNFTNALYQTLAGARIYDDFSNPQVDNTPRNLPGGPLAWADLTLTLLDHSFTEQATVGSNKFGNDYIAGGAGNDRIFGELGDDIIQGDGSMDRNVSARRLADGTLEVAGAVEAETDGDDYIEGNGGNDLIFGGLGQDDIIGGSSNFFGLTIREMRPDGSDMIFGGAGTDIVREDAGDTLFTGRARDADVIAGDNANIIRLVGINHVAGGYLTFGYDSYSTLKIIPRAVKLIDYTPGGADLNAATALLDIGAPDEVHGESGNDTIYGQLGHDVLFGEAQDDDIIGGTGNDWISGGNGEDGVLGDDGRLFTSRNGTPEPLYGMAAIPEGGLSLTISTPGNIQNAIIHVAGALKKTAIVEPFMLKDIETVPGVTPSNDIIFGGLGHDAVHGGAGDDAVSGAEALPSYYAKPFNPGNILRFGLSRAGEFAAYDEYNPRTKIYVSPTTFEFTASTTPGAVEFILNFIATEQDGNDILFGDVGNDWMVGGMGRDHFYGGYGDDLLNADDNDETNGGLNTAPDGPDANQEDLAYGGAGRDVLIANTGGDRLIDWAGEFNSYILPFANFGAATVSRTLQPQLGEFLYDLSASDGADPTRATKTGSSAARNGEPEGELGMVRQQDFDWGDQTGAPADPQAGNIPGGKRDVIRSADFNNGSADDFSPDSGTWAVVDGAFQVTPGVLGGDAVSLFNTLNVTLPRYFEVQATVTGVKPTAGYKANGYIVFDYQSPTDFKFAGVNVSTNKLEIGHRTASGWIVDTSRNMQLKVDQGYNMLLSLNGTTAVLVIDNSSTNVLSFTFAARVEEGYSFTLNNGLVGIGGNNARARIDNVRVQVLPPTITFQDTETLADNLANLLTGAQVGQWTVAGNRDTATPDTLAGFGVSNSGIALATSSVLLFDTTVKAAANGTSAGVVFDYYDSNNFKYAAIVAGTNQVVIGHRTKSGWAIDAAIATPIVAGNDYTLALTLKGTTVSVLLNPSTAPDGKLISAAALGYVYNAVVVDGQAGLFTRGGVSSFAGFTYKTDDPQFLPP